MYGMGRVTGGFAGVAAAGAVALQLCVLPAIATAGSDRAPAARLAIILFQTMFAATLPVMVSPPPVRSRHADPAANQGW